MRKVKYRSSRYHYTNALNQTLIKAITDEDINMLRWLLNYSNPNHYSNSNTNNNNNNRNINYNDALPIATTNETKQAHSQLMKLLLTYDKLSWKTIYLNKYNDTVLHYSCRLGKLNIIRLLLDSKQFNVDDVNKEGDTPLCIACDCGYIDIARLLILHNANSNHENTKGKTPLIFASELLSPYDLQMCKLLIEKGNALVNFQAVYNSNHILLSASKFGNLELIKYLISLNADLNVKFSDGATPLMRACYYNYYDVAKCFLENGAHIEERNVRQETPLYIASYRGHIDIVKLLIEYKSNVNSEDIDGDTPLTVACYEDKADVISYLLKNNGLVNKKGIRGDGPIHISVSNCGTNVVSELIYHDADVDLLNNDNETALHISCKQNRVDMIKILLEYSKNLNIQANTNYTPLKYLIENLQPIKIPIAVNLIQCGADCNLIRFYNVNNDSNNNTQNNSLQSSNELTCLEHIFKIYENNFKNQTDHKLLIDFIEIIINSGYKLSNNEVNLIKILPLFNNSIKRLELINYYKTPNLLTNLCRVQIRRLLKMPLVNSIQCLNIPSLLKEFLYFK